MIAPAIHPEPVPLARDEAGRLVVRHRDEVNDYMAQREVKRAETRSELEARFPPEGLRARLLARLGT